MPRIVVAPRDDRAVGLERDGTIQASGEGNHTDSARCGRDIGNGSPAHDTAIGFQGQRVRETGLDGDHPRETSRHIRGPTASVICGIPPRGHRAIGLEGQAKIPARRNRRNADQSRGDSSSAIHFISPVNHRTIGLEGD